MNKFRTKLHYIFAGLLLMISCLMYKAQAQTPEVKATEISKIFTERTQNFVFYIYDLVEQVINSGQSEKILHELETKANTHHLRARLYVLKAAVLYYQEAKLVNNLNGEFRVSPTAKSAMLELYSKAMNEAYLSGDDRVIAQISFYYGQSCHVMKELELAVTYTMNGLELNEKLGIENSPMDYMIVGEIFYKIREYEECIKNSIKAFNLWKLRKEQIDTIYIDTIYRMFSSNTAALGYHRQQQYDSAFYWYRISFNIAAALKSNVWKGIIGGNMGQIYFEQKKYDTALALFQTDYEFSKEENLFDNAANSLQWAARTQLQLGNNIAALQNVRESLNLLEHTPERFYLRNTYYTAVDIFKTLGVYDSAFYYNSKYAALNDSLEKMIAFSGITVSKARAYNEKSRYSIQSLQKEKEKQLFQRNILIAAIILLGIIGFLFITRQRLKSKLQVERMQQEISSARQQLNMFTEKIVEKTNLIEKLEQQLSGSGITPEQQLLITELSQQTILTEEDWLKFKSLFEKIYPFFFQKLKENAANITVAEQRMAALIRLQLTTRQIASMLGISVDSVHKTRQRLRQRIHLNAEENLDEFIAGT